MKSIITTLFIGSLLSVGTLFAQAPANNTSSKGKFGINLSLWKGVATQSVDTTQSTSVNLGVLSTMNRLNGIGINLLGGISYQQANGIQVAGIFNLNQGNTNGVQLSGITNINGSNTHGISVSGLVNITSNHLRGVSVTGLTNIIGNDANGVTIGGLLNFVGDNMHGISITSIANITGKSSRGIALAGLVNVSGTEAHGLQIAAIGNITSQLNGAQIGFGNVIVKGKGVQIGLVNYYKEQFDGLQLGLVNANPKTLVQPMIYVGNNAPFNIGVRFKNPLYYTILGIGMPYLGFDNKFSASASYRTGIELPLISQLFVSGDFGFQHIESFSNKHRGYPKRFFALQPRISISYHISKQLSLFVTGGYSWEKPYGWGHCIEKKAFVELGTTLLRWK